MLRNFDDFCAALHDCGFSMSGDNPKGIYSVIKSLAFDVDGKSSPVRWHTGDPDTDPWEWRIRVLTEPTVSAGQSDIAYSSVFFKLGGFITAEWYPLFLSVRRNGMTAADEYYSGTMSSMAKRVYDTIEQNGAVPSHELRVMCTSKSDKSTAFERALTELQMKLYITICGRAYKINKLGEPYGWGSMVYTTIEDFWQERGIALPYCDPIEAKEKITAQIYRLNPDADIRKIEKFILG